MIHPVRQKNRATVGASHRLQKRGVLLQPIHTLKKENTQPAIVEGADCRPVIAGVQTDYLALPAMFGDLPAPDPNKGSVQSAVFRHTDQMNGRFGKAAMAVKPNERSGAGAPLHQIEIDQIGDRTAGGQVADPELLGEIPLGGEAAFRRKLPHPYALDKSFFYLLMFCHGF